MKPLIVGHRGTCTEPENTLKAFRKALEMKVDMVELDVRLTKDKVPVVMHDDDVDRTTNGRGKVAEFTLKELKKLDAGDGEKIPTLQEVIDLIKGKSKLMIELKSYSALRPVARLVKQNRIVEDTVVVSFGHLVAKRFKSLAKGIQTGAMLVSIPIDPLRLAEDAKANYLISYYQSMLAGSLVYKRVIKKAKAKKIKVIACELDEKSRMSAEEIRQLIKLGVDGFILNHPDIAIKQLASRKRFGLW
jgi:glycerophosphoryl diester phosphodiesterase